MKIYSRRARLLTFLVSSPLKYLATNASIEILPGPKTKTIVTAKRKRNSSAVTNLSGSLKITRTRSRSAVQYATVSRMSNGNEISREASPRNKSKPPKHSVHAARRAWPCGNGMPRLSKNCDVLDRFINLPLPVRKNCQPQNSRITSSRGERNASAQTTSQR